MGRPPRSTLFPYPPLFRSLVLGAAVLAVGLQAAWLATASILDATAGDGRGLPAGFWGDLLVTQGRAVLLVVLAAVGGFGLDRKSTRLNSSHANISYAVFCL